MILLLPMLFGLGFGEMMVVGQVRSVVMQDQLIIRVPVRPAERQVEWVERDGPKCIEIEGIRGAFVSGEDHVELLMAGRRLLRAKLDENCPALDFYGGFYLASEDGRICAKRNAIRSRMGAACTIEGFRRLVPAQSR